ncbi:hypothetical protein SKAU_G00361320 [Synaphobranchus kaupii]|nr:hypothetical protein SKAU_G00361320 [Synaphobranchus kaupii]
MASFWSQPLQVTRQLGPATFLLGDGSRWHASRLRRVPTPPGPTMATRLPAAGAAEMDGTVSRPPRPVLPRAGPQPMVGVDRPQRERARPSRLQDYVTTFHT